MNVNPGDLVQCVRAFDYGNWSEIPNRPALNGIYTIRDGPIGQPCVEGLTLPAILLEEIHNPPWHMLPGRFWEPAFWLVHFKPIRKPNIQVLRDIVERVGVTA